MALQTTFLLVLTLAGQTFAFSPWTVMARRRGSAVRAAPSSSSTTSSSSSSSSAAAAEGAMGRRGWLEIWPRAAAGISTAAVVVGLPQRASAKGGPASSVELARLRKGYEGLEYLLANFDKETTKCTPECNRNPDAVRSYMGLRSMDHPLYQVEKILSKGQDNLDDPDDVEEYITACENYSSAISESNAMAYTSSFGEYNPGGGKDAVEKYLELARAQVVLARDNLKIILTKLGA